MTPGAPDADALLLRIRELESEFRTFVHSVNNPLGVIRMAVYFLQTAPADHERRDEYFALIGENIDRVEQLVRKARSVYRVDMEGDAGPPPAAGSG